MFGKKPEKYYRCKTCGYEFSNLDASRVCSNCFACSGCEIYNCPACGAEVVIKPVKSVTRGRQSHH